MIQKFHYENSIVVGPFRFTRAAAHTEIVVSYSIFGNIPVTEKNLNKVQSLEIAEINRSGIYDLPYNKTE